MIRFVPVYRSALIAFQCLMVGMLLTGCARFIVSQTACRPPGLDTTDLTSTTDTAVSSLLNSGVFDRRPLHPAVLTVGGFKRETSQQLNLSLLPDQICAPLLKTGKVVVAQKGGDATGKTLGSDAPPRSDFTLSGKVSESRESTEGNRQITYVFSFSLSDTNGLTVCAENKEITKLVRRSNPGF